MRGGESKDYQILKGKPVKVKAPKLVIEEDEIEVEVDIEVDIETEAGKESNKRKSF